MPHMNGFELCEKILVVDINVRICFMSAIKINREGLRETYPSLGIGCFIRKPVTMAYVWTFAAMFMDKSVLGG